MCLRPPLPWAKATQLGLCTVPLPPTRMFNTEWQREPLQQFLTIFHLRTECLTPASLPGSWKLLSHALLLLFDRLEDRSMWWWEMKLALRSLPTFQPLFHCVRPKSACPPNACSHCAQLCGVLLCPRCIYVCFNKVTCIQKCVLLRETSDVATERIILNYSWNHSLPQVADLRLISPILKQWLWKV